MHRPRLAVSLLSLAALAAPLSALAQVERCVRNEPEFVLAWGIAAASSNEPLVIKLAQGTYDLGATQVGGDSPVRAGRPVSIRGGYNNDCTARSDDPAATTLTSSRPLGSRVIGLRTDGGQTGDLELDRLRFFDLAGFFTRSETETSPERSLRISRVIFDTVRSIRILSATDVVIDNSVFWRGGNVSSPALPFNDCGLTVDPASSILERLVIRHSTFVGNTGAAALCVGGTVQFDSNNWSVELTSNIFRNNGPVDIRLEKVMGQPNIPATIRNNIYGTLAANRPLSNATVATLNVDPLFVNAAAGNFRLQGASPAINTGRVDVNLLNQRDFDGNPRWFGDTPDRGAFESNVGSTATVLTVTNTNDSGPGSLRQALIDANAAPNLNVIRFNIAGACPRTITLASLLPDILHPVAIEGYSQPGSSRNTAQLGWNANLCIVLNGANQITGAYGFNVNTGASPNATVSIEGIAFSGHSFAAAQFVAGRNHRFVGNQIGSVVGSTTLLASGTGVRIGGNVEGVRVGGPDPADRNVIGSALGTGVSINGSGATQPTLAVVENNYIGTQSGGDTRGNQRGVFIAGPDHVIRNNVISNSSSHGVELSGSLATGNRITGNRIGVPALCVGSCANRGNGGHGVLLRNSADDNRVEDNQIAYNGLDGIAVTGARRNTLRRNTLYSQGGIGIDLGDDGRNLFDANNTQPAPIVAGNDSQNYPSISDASGNPAVGLVSGQLNSANGWYRLDFYGVPSQLGCSLVFAGGQPQGFFGEGRDWLGSTFVQISNATVSANGSVSYSDVEIRRSGSNNYFVPGTTWVVATATRLSGPPLLGNYRHLGTSEFGRCRQYTAGMGPDLLFSDRFRYEAP